MPSAYPKRGLPDSNGAIHLHVEKAGSITSITLFFPWKNSLNNYSFGWPNFVFMGELYKTEKSCPYVCISLLSLDNHRF